MSMFLDPFLKRAELSPDTVQFVLSVQDEDQAITNAMILDGARRFGATYERANLPPRSVVLISLLPSADLIYAFVGALLAGHVPSLMPFPSAKQDAQHFWASHNQLFNHIGGGILVTFEANVAAVQKNIDPGLLRVLTPDDVSDFEDFTPAVWDEDEVCCLQHSSGTTGLKKGVTLTSRAILDQLTSYQNALTITEEDTVVSWLPLYHDMGFVATFLLPLVIGNQGVIMSPFEWLTKPLKLFALIERYDGRFTWLPNFAFNHLATASEGAVPRDISRMRAFISCSEPCKATTFDRFLEAFSAWGISPAHLQTCYAMAETVFAVTQSTMGQIVPRIAVSASALQKGNVTLGGNDAVPLLSVGTAIQGMSVKIAGSKDIGEILLASNFVFEGYYKKFTSDIFEDGYYKTGDLGFLHDGELYILGREKDLLIVLGKNFYAHDIEAIVSVVPGIKPGRAAALGIYNEEIGSEEAVVIVERDGTQPDSAIRKAVKTQLSDLVGLVPKRIMIVEQGWLVKSTSGKMSRSENMKKYHSVLEHNA